MTSDAEKAARRERRKAREKAKREGTYVPRGKRKDKQKRDILAGASRRSDNRTEAEKEYDAERQRRLAPKRIRKSTGVEPKFVVGEPCLVKAVVVQHVYPAEGAAKYEISFMESPRQIQEKGKGKMVEYGIVIEERFLARWPRK